MDKLTFTMENYLEAVYELSRKGLDARLADIAERLSVTKSTATLAVSALAKKGLIEQGRYRRAVVLTKAGRDMAAAVAEKHKTIERFFSDVLNLNDKIADTDACAIEHVISDEATQAMREFLRGYVRERGGTNGRNEKMVERKKKNPESAALIPSAPDAGLVDENALFERVAAIIENRKSRAAAYVNSEGTLMFWEVGQYINSVVLGNQRAAYGKQILTTLSAKLTAQYGKSFSEQNLYRMTQFAERFSDFEILSPLTTKLSWTHFCELIRVKTAEARMFYAEDAAAGGYGVRELRRRISRKGYERREIANMELTETSSVPFNVFRDPYLLDLFGLKDNFLEADLEQAILTGIQSFLLEFGHGIAFVDRQKRMILDGKDIVLDLLLYSRTLRRLIAIDLKIGEFKASYKGQMELYLKWLNRYERQPGEEAPIGIILCASANREIIELLEPDKTGIAVAEYWTHLPSKAEFERKIREILMDARERLERRKLLTDSGVQRQIDYFIEPKDDEDEW